MIPCLCVSRTPHGAWATIDAHLVAVHGAIPHWTAPLKVQVQPPASSHQLARLVTFHSIQTYGKGSLINFDMFSSHRFSAIWNGKPSVFFLVHAVVWICSGLLRYLHLLQRLWVRWGAVILQVQSEAHCGTWPLGLENLLPFLFPTHLLPACRRPQRGSWMALYSSSLVCSNLLALPVSLLA
jgi:hypothetical protein